MPSATKWEGDPKAKEPKPRCAMHTQNAHTGKIINLHNPGESMPLKKESVDLSKVLTTQTTGYRGLNCRSEGKGTVLPAS